MSAPPPRQTGRPGYDVPRPAAVYGAAGLIPLVAAAVAVWVAPPGWDVLARNVQLFYGAAILSFLGAVHWGLALAGIGAGGDEQKACSWRRLGWSVAPAMVAWISLVMVPLVGLVTQILAFAAAFVADQHAARAGLAPPWYPRLRRPLTSIAILALGAVLLRQIWAG